MRSNDPLVMPLRWLSDTQRTRLVNRLSDASEEVVKDWRARSNVEVLKWKHVRSAVEHVTGKTFHVTDGADILLTWTLGTDALRQLGVLPPGTLVEQHHRNGLLGQVEFDFVNSLSRVIIPGEWNSSWQLKQSEVLTGTTVHSKRSLQYWFQLAVGGQSACCELIMSSKLIDYLVPRVVQKTDKQLGSRRKAIADQTVMLHASLGQIEVPFNELKSLAKGDVLVMQSSLASSVRICNSEGRNVAAGFLGRDKRHLAVHLSSVELPVQAKMQSEKRSIR